MPKGWSHNRLDSVCSKITDGAHHSPKSVDIGYPMYSVKDMSYSGFYENTARLIDEVDYLSLVNQNCKPLINDILIAKDGSILKHCFVVKENVEGVILSSIALLRPKLEKIYPEYIAQYFSQEWVKSFVVRALTSGSGVPRIILKDFKSIKIPLPPLPEQQKIAKILSTWDKAISTTECLIDNSTQQKKALMQQLLTGKKRLLDDEGQRFGGEWERLKLEDVVTKTQLGTSERTKDVEEISTIPLIKMGNLTWGGFSFDKLETLPKSKVDESLILKSGDFLFNTRNTPELVGKSAVWKEQKVQATFDNNINRITFNQNINTDFMCLYLTYGKGKSLISSLSAGSTSVAAIYWKDLKNIKLPVPTLSEQQKIATVLTNADKEIELLEQQLADLQQEKKALMQVLLTGKKRVVIDGEIA